jgi:hypothetical protein
MKYLCLEDVMSFGVVMIPKGAIVEAGQKFNASGLTLELSEFLLMDNPMFEPIQMSVTTREHSDDTEQIERDWIIEVKVRTNRSKLRAIEEFLSDNLPGML